MTLGRRFVTVDVFTDRAFGGNPLAVLPEADGLDAAGMQRIAAEFNLSETAFVFAPARAEHTARVRIFTPRSELPFAGHPSVGTAFVLARLGKTAGDALRFEQQAGVVAAHLARDADGTATGATIEAPCPLVRGGDIDAVLAAAAGSLAAADIDAAGHPPLLASVGTVFAIARVTPEALARAAPDAAACARLGEATGTGFASIYVYALEADGADGTARATARLFAPGDGIPEDPATGSAAAALGALLLSLAEPGRASRALTVRQGDAIGRPSRIDVEARRASDGIRASVGGGCVMMSEGRLLV